MKRVLKTRDGDVLVGYCCQVDGKRDRDHVEDHALSPTNS